MKPAIRAAYNEEICVAMRAEAEGRLEDAFAHLERAHIVGQRYFITHLDTHMRMLRIASRKRDMQETRGQVVRLLAVLPGYAFGWVPKGNPGGANVSAVKPMAPPSDLEPLLRDYNIGADVALRLALWAGACFTAYALATA